MGFFLPWCVAMAPASAETLNLRFDSVQFEKAKENFKVALKGSASPSINLYLTEVEVRTSASALKALTSRVETSLGVKADKNRLLVTTNEAGEFAFELKLPLALVKLKFEVEHKTGSRLGEHMLAFGVMDSDKILLLNVRRSFEYFPPKSVAPSVELTGPAQRGFWVWAGAGFNYTMYQQTIENVGTFDDNDLAGPSIFAELGYKHKTGFGASASYKSTPGEVKLEGTNIEGAKYTWSTISFEGIYEKSAASPVWGGSFFYGALLGIQNHEFPYFHQDDVLEMSLREIKMQTASVGFLTRLQRGSIDYHWSMRYQYPVSVSVSELENFDINTRFAFDGSVGLTYHFNPRWEVGWYWYGQWHEYDLGFAVNTTRFTGSQTLFYSNMDLRLGVDF